MRTRISVTLHAAKVLKNPRSGEVVTVKEGKTGEYAELLVADIQTGFPMTIFCFDRICSQAKNMGLKPGEDTLFIQGDMLPQAGSRGFIIKAISLDFGPKLNRSAQNAAAEVSKVNIFGENPIPKGKSFG